MSRPGARVRWRATLTGAAVLGAVLIGSPAAWAVPVAPDGGEDQLEVQVVIPERAGVAVTDAQLRWGLNAESGSGAYFGGCNFLSAGRAGDSGSARVWVEADGFYQAEQGEVRIEKTNASGGRVLASWSSRCQDRSGASVTVSAGNNSDNQVVIDGGVGTVDPAAGTATIRWAGSFTVAFYGGMTYWSATDPVLTVAADGTGALTATVSGYGADMDDLSVWQALRPRVVTLADLSAVELSELGFSVDPDYRGVSVQASGGRTAQAALDDVNRGYWGAFPQSFVDFQVETGQSAYWYTSGGARDTAKVASALTVSFDASNPATERPTTPQAGGSVSPSNPVTTRPSDGGSGSGQQAARAGQATASQVEAAQDVATGAFPAMAAQTLLAASSLIPVAASLGVSGALLVPGLGTGVLLLGSGAVLGLRKGWLVLPWK